MKDNNGSGRTSARKWVTVRVAGDEWQRRTTAADRAGLSTSEYVLRKLHGGWSLIAQTDVVVIRKLRLTGGLPKHFSFSALREIGAPVGILGKQEETLRLSAKKTAVLGKMSHSLVTTKKTEEICNTKAHKNAWRADGIRVVHRTHPEEKNVYAGGEIFVGRNACRTQGRIDWPCGRKRPQRMPLPRQDRGYVFDEISNYYLEQ